jgi:Flp pilus assembly protein TadD
MTPNSIEPVQPFNWEQAKPPSHGPRAAGLLFEAYAQDGNEFRSRELRLRTTVTEAVDDRARREANHLLGLHLEAAGNLEAAEGALSKAVALSEADSISGSAAMNDHGVVLARLGRHREADDEFVTALEHLGGEGRDTLALALRRNRALMAWLGGDAEGALQQWNGVFSSAREENDTTANAQILNNVAVMKLVEGEVDEAVLLLNRAVLLAQRGGDVRGLAFMYNNLGLVYSGPPRGDHFAAIPFVEMALALLEGSIDILARLYVLNNNIIVYEQAHLEPARKFRAQWANVLKAFTTAYPSRAADAEHLAFSRNSSDISGGEMDGEWEISSHPGLLRAYARCGVRE